MEETLGPEEPKGQQEFPNPPCLPKSYKEMSEGLQKWDGAWQPVEDPTLKAAPLQVDGTSAEAVSPNCSEILPYLYLGNLQCASDVKMLQERCITHVLTLTKRLLPQEVVETRSCRQLVIEDKPKAQIQDIWDEAFEHIIDAKHKGGSVLVHCRAGVSRGSCCCMAYLMKYYGMSLRDSYALVKRCRPIVHPNKGFIDQLRSWEHSLRGHIASDADIDMRELPFTLWERAQHLGLNDPIPNLELSLLAEEKVAEAFKQRYSRENPYLTMDAGLGGKMHLHSVELYWAGDFEWIDQTLVDVLFTNRPANSNYVSKKQRRREERERERAERAVLTVS